MRKKFISNLFIKNLINARAVLSVIAAAAMLCAALPPGARALAAPSFNDSVRAAFVNTIIAFGRTSDGEYNRYALHDFDGDGIPELLIGKANLGSPLYAEYGVFKFDIVNSRFLPIGHIAESRYFVRDLYSSALIGIYTVENSEFTIYSNYYIAHDSVHRNTPLVKNAGESPVTYDGSVFAPGYFRNDVPITKDAFDQDEIAHRGTYDEVIVYDLNGYDDEVAYIAVNAWKPPVIPARPKVFTSADQFTKTWQLPMYALIDAKRRPNRGPANTSFDEYALNRDVVRETYRRYALYDLDGDRVPELLFAVQRDSQLSWDVYKYWNNQMHFIGSFDGYGKYLAAEPAGSLFSFDPAPNKFYQQAGFSISFSPSNTLKKETLLQSSYTSIGYIYQLPDSKGVNMARVTHDKYLGALLANVLNNREIKTFDLEMSLPTAALIMYVRTGAFTRP